MAMQSYTTAPGRNKSVAAGPPKGLIAGAMARPSMTPAPKPAKKMKSMKKGKK